MVDRYEPNNRGLPFISVLQKYFKIFSLAQNHISSSINECRNNDIFGNSTNTTDICKNKSRNTDEELVQSFKTMVPSSQEPDIAQTFVIIHMVPLQKNFDYQRDNEGTSYNESTENGLHIWIQGLKYNPMKSSIEFLQKFNANKKCLTFCSLENFQGINCPMTCIEFQ